MNYKNENLIVKKYQFFNFYIFLFCTTILTISAKSKKQKFEIKNKQKEEKQDDKVKTNFDEIKEYLSYDPATGKWSKIKDFETVKIIEKEKPYTQGIPEYIYQNFWAYDEKKKIWYEVNISEIGYIPPKYTKWKNFARYLSLDISIGPEIGYNKIITRGENISFFTTVYGKIWIADKNQNSTPYNLEFLSISKSKNRNELFSIWTRAASLLPFDYLYGLSYQLPITFSLHYTFNNPRIRLGLGNSIVFNFTNTYFPTSKKNKIYITSLGRKSLNLDFGKLPYEKNPNIILRPFILLGWIVNKNIIHHALIDMRIGLSMYPNQLKSKSNSLYGGYGNIGVGYEKRIGNYFKSIFRIGAGFEFFKIASIDINESPQNYVSRVKGTIISYMLPSIVIELGIGSYFAKNKNVENAFKKLDHQNLLKAKIKKSKKNKKKFIRNY